MLLWVNLSVGQLCLLVVRIEVVFHFQFHNLLLSLAHLLIQSLQSLLEHGDCLLEGLNCLWEGLFNEDTPNDFPALSISLEARRWLTRGHFLFFRLRVPGIAWIFLHTQLWVYYSWLGLMVGSTLILIN